MPTHAKQWHQEVAVPRYARRLEKSAPIIESNRQLIEQNKQLQQKRSAALVAIDALRVTVLGTPSIFAQQTTSLLHAVAISDDQLVGPSSLSRQSPQGSRQTSPHDNLRKSSPSIGAGHRSQSPPAAPFRLTAADLSKPLPPTHYDMERVQLERRRSPSPPVSTARSKYAYFFSMHRDGVLACEAIPEQYTPRNNNPRALIEQDRLARLEVLQRIPSQHPPASTTWDERYRRAQLKRRQKRQAMDK